ncbi:MAG: hypothetical protein IT320_20905 [Anaerolineae bacterium]|nr:hypothetical protein [Anaerolineae bacterium]
MAIEVRLQRGNLREPEEVEPALRAALPGKYAGMSTTPSEAILYLIDGSTGDDTQLAHDTYTQVVNAIDPKVPPPSEQKRLKRLTHLQTIQTLDFADIKAQIDGISNISQAKTTLTRLARVVWEMLALMDLNQSDMGDE